MYRFIIVEELKYYNMVNNNSYKHYSTLDYTILKLWDRKGTLVIL